MNKRRAILAGGCCIALMLLCTSSATATKPSGVFDRTLPDLDRRLPAVLDLDSGELAVAPPSRSFANVEEYKAALVRLGDLAYENADGGMLFVASGATLPLGTAKPDAKTLRKLGDRLETRTFLKRDEIEPGSWFAVRSRAGKLALGRVVTRTPKAIRIGWAPPTEAHPRLASKWVDALAALEPSRLETALLPPLSHPPLPGPEANAVPPKAPKTVLRLANGRLVTGPAPPEPFRPGALGPLVNEVGKTGDLAYFRPRSGMLVVGAGKMARLGTGPLSPLEGRDLRQRLKERSIIPAAELLPGNAMLVETTAGRYALLRVDAVESEGLRITWLLQPDGSAAFPDLAAFDASFEIADPKQLDRLLLAATTRGDAALMRRLLAMGANANTSSSTASRPALVYAVINGDADILALLLEAGADLAGAGDDGWNALHVAAKLGRMDLVETLLAAGADTQTRTSSGNDALRIALASPRQNLDLIRFLRQNTDTTDTLAIAARVGDVTAIRSLLAAGANVDRRHDGGQTALEVAAASGQADAVRALLAVGADPSFESDAGVSPLEAAAAKGHVATAAILVEHGGSTNVQKTSALYQANQSGSVETARVLLNGGADALGNAGQAFTPLDYTFQYGDETLVDVYLEQGYELSVAAAARLGRVEQLAALLSSGVDPHRASPDGRSPLQLAIQSNRSEAVEVLLSYGVNADIPLPTWDQRTPLHEAAARAESDTVGLLLSWGAQTDQLDRVGRTPLYDAVSHGREETVRVLLEHGADPNLAPAGEALIDIAGHESMRALLASYGALSSEKSRRN